ncbi:hypothetical protein AA313_de0209575 [Arthrobotrys entomopaga]|nr:hypothetical protein AA313_de0209575 [Arthrobotrys entomopaga]
MKVTQIISAVVLMAAAASALPAVSSAAAAAPSSVSKAAPSGVSKAAPSGTASAGPSAASKGATPTGANRAAPSIPPLPSNGAALKADFLKHAAEDPDFPPSKKAFFQKLDTSVWDKLLVLEKKMRVSLQANNPSIDLAAQLGNAWDSLFNGTIPDFNNLPTVMTGRTLS